MDLFKHFIKSSILYLLGSVLSKLIGFILLPVLTNYLYPDQLGYYDVANTYLNLVTTFLFLDIYVGIMRFIYDCHSFDDSLKPIFNGILIFLISLGIYTVLAFIIYLIVDISYFVYVYIYGVSIVFNNLFGYIARAFKRNKLFAFSGIIATFLTAAINFIGLVCFKADISILYISSIVGLTVQILVIEYHLSIVKKLSRKLFDKQLFVQLYKFSFPLCLNSLAFWLLTGYGNIMISHFLGLDQNGIYLVAIKFALVINLASMCFNLAWQEIVFEKSNENKSYLDSMYTRSIGMLINFLSFFVLCLIHFSFFIFPYMVGKEFDAAFELIPLSIFSASLSVISGFLGQIYAALKKTSIILYSTAAAAFVNIICLPFFIHYFSIKGVFYSLIISYLVNLFMRFYLIRNTVLIQLNYKFILLFLILLSFSFVIYYKGDLYLNLVGLVLLGGGLLYNQRQIWYSLIKKII